MYFDKDYEKLKKKEFITIRGNFPYYDNSDATVVQSPSRMVKFLRCSIVKREKITKKDITDELAYADSECSRDELIAKLEKWYGEAFDDFVILTLRKWDEDDETKVLDKGEVLV